MMHATLRTMLNAALDDGIIVANPADKLARQLKLSLPPSRRQDTIKAMTRAQLVLFLATAEPREPRLYPLFLTLARAGVRIGEALALQWDDINFAEREMRIARGFSKGRLETPKSGVARNVDLSQQLTRVLLSLQVARKAETLRRGWPGMPTWVFCTQQGTPYDLGFLQRVYKRILKQAHSPYISRRIACDTPTRACCCRWARAPCTSSVNSAMPQSR